MASPRSGIPEPAPAQSCPWVTLLKGKYDCTLFYSRNDSPPYKESIGPYLVCSSPLTSLALFLRLLALFPLTQTNQSVLLFSNVPNTLLPQGFCKCLSLFPPLSLKEVQELALTFFQSSSSSNVIFFRRPFLATSNCNPFHFLSLLCPCSS